LVIAGRLCFVACDTPDVDGEIGLERFRAANWCVVWGDAAGPWFDDVHGLTEFKGQPVYIARAKAKSDYEYCVVWGNRRSQGFPFQISCRIENDRIHISRFDTRRTTPEDEIEVQWHED